MLARDDHVVFHVDDYLHDALDPADAEYVERHCDACRICGLALEEARRRRDALAALPVTEPSEGLIRGTLERLETDERRRDRRRRRFGLAVVLGSAAAALVLAGFTAHYWYLAASPVNLTVLGQTSLLADSSASLRVRLVNAVTGLPLAGVPVTIELRDPRKNRVVRLAGFQTDPEGTGQPRFRLPSWENGTYALRVVARAPEGDEVITRDVQVRRSWKVMLSSDKPVYQPGQVIHARSMTLRRPDLKPVAGQPVKFTVRDPKGNVIFKQQDVTSRHGIAAIDCPLADELIEGAYVLGCQLGDTTASRNVEVKKYVLPKFKLAVEVDRPYYQPGAKIVGTVRSDYFFGKPVADAEVRVDVRMGTALSDEVRPVTARTAADGTAKFEFRLPGLRLAAPGQENADTEARVTVVVKDTAGQTETKTVTRVVTERPLRIEVIPEGGTLVEGVTNTVYLYVSYPDGRPARARIILQGFTQELNTNALGVATVELKPQRLRDLWAVRADDGHGATGKWVGTLTRGQAANDFIVRTDRAVYDGGSTMRLTVLGGGREPVFVDLIKDGQTLLTEAVPLKDGRGEFRFDLPPDLFGTMELCAYRLGNNGPPVRRMRALYARPAGQVQIRAELDRSEYRPGKEATLRLALTDRRGNPQPGALSLAAVDEAVYALLDQPPGMERMFYTIERQLLEPVYKLYDWSPEEPAADPDARAVFEQALFARTARSNLPILPAGAWQSSGSPGEAGVVSAPPHSLMMSSFAPKDQAARAAREVGLAWVRVGWFIALIVAVALGLVVLEVAPRTWLAAIPLCTLIAAVAAIGLFSQLSPMRNAAESLPSDATLEASARLGGPGVKVWNDGSRWGSAGSTLDPDVASAFPDGTSNTIIFGQKAMRPSMEGQSQTPAAPPVRVREWFPETLLWRPEVITDDQGRATVDISLADSITTWRLAACAVTTDGRLGAAQVPVRVFQPFFADMNLPVALTRGDEVTVPVVVYNYLDRPQTVELTLADGDWFERRGAAVERVTLKAREVRSAGFRLRAARVGRHELQVTARGSGVADAVKRSVEVVPDGRRVEQAFNGTLQQPASVKLTVPADAVPGSARATLKIYPSAFSQLVEGLDSIFEMPYGCFEQTSSTTYPNVLALDYLRRTGKSLPAVEAKARQYIHLGYQRLLSFEVPGGGFDWFGHPPANRTLTAYGLMEFRDMARVHDVDASLIERTRTWLLRQQDADGSWAPEGHLLHDDPTGGGRYARLRTTAYIAWAVFGSQPENRDGTRALQYLLSAPPETIDDPHVLALVCNAVRAIDPQRDVGAYVGRLEVLKKLSPNAEFAWWEQPAGAWTTFYGHGRAGSVETTALAALALITANEQAGTVRQALAWVAAQKGPGGNWYSTQATVLALKALLAGTGRPLGGDRERQVEIAWDDGSRSTVSIPADQADVVRQIDLTRRLKPGTRRLTLTERSGTAAGYQVAFRYHVPDRPTEKSQPLAINVAYDRTSLAVGDSLEATVRVVNRMTERAPMVVLELPVPPGFTASADDFAEMVRSQTIAKFQMGPRGVTVYLRGLDAGKPFTIRYRLRATMAGRVTAAAARAYEYYDTDQQGSTEGVRLTVAER